MKNIARIKLTVDLPPKAAAVFLAVCALEAKTPTEAALAAIATQTSAYFTTGGLQAEIESLFKESDVDGGKEES